MQRFAPLRARLLWIVALILLAGIARGGGATPAPRKGLTRAELGDAIRKELAAKGLRGADVGVAAFDLIDRKLVFTHNPDKLLSVASNNKLVTTAAALELLGAGFEFRTTVAAVGKLMGDGTLRGDLLVIGRGDPSLSGRFHQGKVTAVLEQWAEAVAEAGVKSVRGGIVADDTYFDRQYTHPEWTGNHASWYRAQVCGLSFNDNCIDLVVRPGSRRGALARIATQPPTRYVRIVNTCKTSGLSNRVLIHRLSGKNQITVGGNIRQRSGLFRGSITIHDPARYTATVFKEVLEAKGIRVGGLVRLRQPGYRFRPDAYREIITTTSSLADAVAVANQRSQNFYAEQILKTLGRETQGKGTWAGGAAAVAEFLRQAKIRGPFHTSDGSGLARGNRFSARQLAAVLAYINCRRTSTLYWRSLAQPGKAGTLANRRFLRPLQGRLFAKTGYIRGVSALSGYLECMSGRLLAFSILVNNFRASLADVRKTQDRICLHLARYEPKLGEE